VEHPGVGLLELCVHGRLEPAQLRPIGLLPLRHGSAHRPDEERSRSLDLELGASFCAYGFSSTTVSRQYMWMTVRPVPVPVPVPAPAPAPVYHICPPPPGACMARGHGQMRHPGKCVVTAASSVVPRSVAVLALGGGLVSAPHCWQPQAMHAVGCPLVARCQINADYAATAVLISFGAVLGKAPPRARSSRSRRCALCAFACVCVCARAAVGVWGFGAPERMCGHKESRPSAIA
jgi:hypothetical protein